MTSHTSFLKGIARRIALGLAVMSVSTAYAYRYDYVTVPDDPMNVLQYTLPNGLKVYMAVNPDKPRIQTYVTVRVGGKNDPAETTGLAHYFEHLMFKGTRQFGTTDYEAEAPLLDRIEELFETYRVTTDSTARAAIYHEIDSISYEASKLAIPNEYDKLMATIGSNGSNAFTTNDQTSYVEDIPSNQMENWAKIQADRFEYPILRGFHTELETIYEEKNMSLTNDYRKIYNTMFEALFPNHPYGTQTVLGTQEHLKNPSITNVKEYHKQWYVPNNMSIALAGDFDPDEAIDIITRYFGHLKPNYNLPVLKFKDEEPITSPIRKEVLGQESEILALAWRTPAAGTHDSEVLDIVDNMLCNQGGTGLIDININQAQKALGASSGLYTLTDHGLEMLFAMPKEGQTLDDVRELLLTEIEKLRNGDFDEEMITSVVNNYRLNRQRELESNEAMASMMTEAFVNNQDWADVAGTLDRQAKITKADIVDFANRYLGPDNYVAVYKLQGEDTTQVKMPKPTLTPLEMNRDKSSRFLNEVVASTVVPIEPVFVDYEKELTFDRTNTHNLPIIYRQNTSNDIATLSYMWDYGTLDNKYLHDATIFMDVLDAPGLTQEQLKNELYSLACNYWFNTSGDMTRLNISGLSENLPKAAALVEKFVTECVADTAVYNVWAQLQIKSLNNEKDNEDSNQSRLNSYVMFGDTVLTQRTTPEEYLSLDPEVYTRSLRDLFSKEHSVVYYGPATIGEVKAMVDNTHRAADKLTPVTRHEPLPYLSQDETVFYIAPYNSKQLKMILFSCEPDEVYQEALQPLVILYNTYFGGSMNAIVFQEMRERRSLAYSAWSNMGWRNRKLPYYYMAGISTQNDKMTDAISAFDEIINDMPESQDAFDIAKSSMENDYRTSRIIKGDLAWNYISEKRAGRDYDSRRPIYEALPSLTMDDLIRFQKEHVKGRKFHYAILGNPEDIDIPALEKLGKVVMLTTDQIFGF